MSTAACRRCGELISFVLTSNGRWRPVEAQYTALELEEDEVTTLRVEGNWTAQPNTEIRVYRYHRCPEDPSLRIGQARTSVVRPELVDTSTGVVEDPDDEDDEDELNWAAKRAYDAAVRRIPSTHVGSACPICQAAAGEPCRNSRGYLRSTTHPQRGWVTAFGDDEPWPPDPQQRGYRVMQQWLAANPSIFATPEKEQ